MEPVIQEFLSSRQWYAQSYGDYILIEAVRQSLDMTIEAIGKERFKDALEQFQRMNKEAERICASKAIFPCNIDGKKQIMESQLDCYSKDAGCGYPCLDANF